MKKIVIFGGSGFVGQNLAKHYLGQGHRFWLADINYPPVDEFKGNYVGCDIRVPMHVRTILYQIKPDLIINCAGQTSHPASMQHPASDADVNVIGNLVLLEEARKTCPDVAFFHISSSTVVGESKGVIDEKTICAPIDIYSANKLAMETYLMIYHKVYEMDVRILRFPNLYGPYGKDDPAYGFANYFIQQATRGKNLTVYGMGEQLRSLLYISDAMAAIDLALKVSPKPIFIATKSLSIRKMADSIAKNWDVEVEFVDWPPGSKLIELGDAVIDSGEFRNVTGWYPRYSLRQGLEETKEIMDNENE